MYVQFAEASPEGQVLFWADVLIAEKDHLMFVQGVLNDAEFFVGQIFPEIDAMQFRADHGIERLDRNGISAR
jgi:hypothetical protein